MRSCNTNVMQNGTQEVCKKEHKENATNLCERERVPCQKNMLLKVQISDLLWENVH